MIRYAISLAKLKAKITAQSADWLDRAQARTDAFRAAGKYNEQSSIWSEIKPVYMRLQGNSKCAYCERKLESLDYGKGEQDVEHFRPKSSVKAWKAPKALKDVGIPFASLPAGDKGYYLLPYHPFNYSAACKPCNSALKSNYFPIAGSYNLDKDDPTLLTGEQPYLLYPIGDLDDAPEKIITFHGLSPRPVAASGYPRNRALVTIEFFKLDAVEKRKNLFRERAIILMVLFPQLEKMHGAGSATEKAEAKAIVKGFTGPNAPHTNCARSFKRLFETDPAEARAFYEAAVTFITTIS